MSRIGKKGIQIPDKTEISINSGAVLVKGPKGSLERNFRPDISIVISDKSVSLTPAKENKQTKAL